MSRRDASSGAGAGGSTLQPWRNLKVPSHTYCRFKSIRFRNSRHRAGKVSSEVGVGLPLPEQPLGGLGHPQIDFSFSDT